MRDEMNPKTSVPQSPSPHTQRNSNRPPKLKKNNIAYKTRSRMTSHLYGWRSTFIPMWWDIWRRRHHHRIGVLNYRHSEHFTTVLIKLNHTLGALMIVRMSIGLDGCRRHRGPRPCTIWWRWVCTGRRGHISLRC